MLRTDKGPLLIISGVFGMGCAAACAYFLFRAASEIAVGAVLVGCLIGLMLSRYQSASIGDSIRRRRLGLPCPPMTPSAWWPVVAAIPVLANGLLQHAEPGWRFGAPAVMFAPQAAWWIDCFRRTWTLRLPIEPMAGPAQEAAATMAATIARSSDRDVLLLDIVSGHRSHNVVISNHTGVECRVLAQYLGQEQGREVLHELPGPVLPPGVEVAGKVAVAGSAIRIVALAPDDTVVFQHQYSWDELEQMGWRVQIE